MKTINDMQRNEKKEIERFKKKLKTYRKQVKHKRKTIYCKKIMKIKFQGKKV